MVSILSAIGTVLGVILKVLVFGALALLFLSLVVTAVMDLYEVRTGESWKARCERLSKKEEMRHE